MFSTEPELQRSYAQVLHRATKPGARLYMFEFGAHNRFKMPRSRRNCSQIANSSESRSVSSCGAACQESDGTSRSEIELMQ